MSSLSYFDGRIDEAFAAAHGVKEEFGRRQAGEEAVLDKALGGWQSRFPLKVLRGGEGEER